MVQYINNQINELPIGSIVMWGSESSSLAGWMECDGRVISVSQYEALHKVIGNRYCSGSESSSEFRLPDLRGLFVRGATGDDSLSRIQPDSFKAHSHQYECIEAEDKGSGILAKDTTIDGDYGYGHPQNTHDTISLINPNAVNSAETRPVNMSLKYYIRCN